MFWLGIFVKIYCVRTDVLHGEAPGQRLAGEFGLLDRVGEPTLCLYLNFFHWSVCSWGKSPGTRLPHHVDGKQAGQREGQRCLLSPLPDPTQPLLSLMRIFCTPSPMDCGFKVGSPVSPLPAGSPEPCLSALKKSHNPMFPLRSSEAFPLLRLRARSFITVCYIELFFLITSNEKLHDKLDY